MFNDSTAFTMPVAPVGYTGGGFGNNGMFGDGGWWAILILFALFGGFGRNGFGGFGGGFGGDAACATQADVRNAVDQQTLISKLDQQTYGLADSTYALNNAINGGFNGVQQTLCQGFNGVNTAILQSVNGTERGFTALSSQLADCCCENRAAIADVKYQMATQACETRQAIADSTKSVIDFLVQDKLSTLQAENQNLKLQASQAAQNAYLVNELRPSPIPAYTVANPYCCYGYNNYNSCGCVCA